MTEKKKKSEKDSEDTEEKKQNFISKTVAFFTDDKTKAVLGIFIFCFSLFSLFAIISYFFTWQTDQSKLTISWFSLLGNENINVDNWAGKTGAYISNLFIHDWFGIPSISILLFLILISFYLLNYKFLPFGKTTKYLMFLTLWFSIALGYLFEERWFVLGGANGFFISKWLNSAVGKIGTFFILGVTAFTFIIFVFRDALQWFKKILRKSKDVILPTKPLISSSNNDDTDLNEDIDEEID